MCGRLFGAFRVIARRWAVRAYPGVPERLCTPKRLAETERAAASSCIKAGGAGLRARTRVGASKKTEQAHKTVRVNLGTAHWGALCAVGVQEKSVPTCENEEKRPGVEKSTKEGRGDTRLTA